MKILLIDDEKSVRNSLAGLLTAWNYQCTQFASGEEALKLSNDELKEHRLAIIDRKFGSGLDGPEIGIRIHNRAPEMKLLLLTAYNDEALQLRYASDAEFSEAFYAIQDKPLREKRLKSCLDALQLAPGPRNIHGSIIGESQSIIKVIESAQKVADNLTNVLLIGETGTGKELIARLLHEQSCRRERPYLAVNCAGLPSSTLESELFGHRKGSFTGAHADHKGIFEQVDGGTIFLDEIDKMPREQQAKLLRVIAEGSFRPLGAERDKHSTFRLVAATNTSLEAMASDGAFLWDLFYRIREVPLELPPLRERGNDILLLAKHFLKAEQTRSNDKRKIDFDDKSRHKLLEYKWPGNVRELRSCIREAYSFLDKSADKIEVKNLFVGENPSAKRMKLAELITLINSIELEPDLSSKDRGRIIELEQAYSSLQGRIIFRTAEWLAEINGKSASSNIAALSFLLDKDLSKRSDLTTRNVTEKLPQKRVIDFYDILNPKAPRGKVTDEE